MTRDDLVAFHRARFTAAATVVVVSGDVLAYDMLGAVQDAYAHLKAPVAAPGSAAGKLPSASPQAATGPTRPDAPKEPEPAGLRYAMSVVPLDPAPVSGSHGRLPDDPRHGPVLVCSDASAKRDRFEATEVRDLLASLLP